jgi:hypothetical protein
VIENGVTRNVDADYGGGVTFMPDPSTGSTTTDVVISGHNATSVPAEGGGVLNQSPAEI